VEKFKFAVFDFDGTLVENMKILRYFFKKILNLNPNSFLGKFFISMLILREKFCPKLVLILWEKLNILIYEIFNKIEKSFSLFDGVRKFLEKLSKNQVKMFVVTAGSKSLKVKQKLEKLKVLSFFEKVSGREISKEEAIILFAKHVGIGPNDFYKKAFFVSDGLKDMFIAKKLGMFGVGITNTFDAKKLKVFGAKRVVASFKELEKL